LWGQAAYGEKGVLRAIRSRFLFPPILPSPVLTAIHLSILNPYSIVKFWIRLGPKLIPVMEDEIIMAMRLLGVRKIDEITPGMVECLKEVWR
jgi:hypothetical protein